MFSDLSPMVGFTAVFPLIRHDRVLLPSIYSLPSALSNLYINYHDGDFLQTFL